MSDEVRSDMTDFETAVNTYRDEKKVKVYFCGKINVSSGEMLASGWWLQPGFGLTKKEEEAFVYTIGELRSIVDPFDDHTGLYVSLV